MNPSEGRVPVSWNECADWLDAFGREFVVFKHPRIGSRYIRTACAADRMRAGDMGAKGYSLSDYRLLPPPNLVAAPEGMDGGGWLGQGKDVPDGWEWRGFPCCEWQDGHPTGLENQRIVQCRPPAPKREAEWVPLTKLVGRTVWGETAPVWDWAREGKTEFWSPSIDSNWRPFPDGTLDLDTGRVKVEPEEEQ